MEIRDPTITTPPPAGEFIDRGVSRSISHGTVNRGAAGIMGGRIPVVNTTTLVEIGDSVIARDSPLVQHQQVVV